MKRHLSVFISSVMLLSAVFGNLVSAGENGYLTRSEVCGELLEAADDYNAAASAEDIMRGFNDGDGLASRSEALVMLKRAFGDIPELKGGNLMLALPKGSFNDIPENADAEFEAVIDSGIAAGTGKGTFSPNENITKAQLDRFIERTYNAFGSNPKDNFFAYVNKTSLDNAVLNKGYAITGALYSINEQNDRMVKELIKETAAKPAEEGTGAYYIKTLYNNIMDMESRNAQGYEPIKPYLDEIDGAQNIKDIEDMVVKLNEDLGLWIMGFSLTVDLKDSDSYTPYFCYPAASFDKSVYNGENETTEKALRSYLKKLLMLCGEDEAQAQKDSDYNFEFEKMLANNSLEPQERYDAEKTYNIYTLDEIDSVFKNVDIKRIFELSGLKTSDHIMVTDVKCMEENARLFSDENIDMLKAVLKANLIHSGADCFGEDFKKAADDFKAERMGMSDTYDSETDAAVKVMNALPDYLGEVYAEKYSSAEVNADISSLIEEVKATYKEKIEKLDWMSDATKQRAITKLNAIKAKVGAPTEWDDILDGYEFKSFADGGSCFDNYVTISKAVDAYTLGLEGETVDKSKWIMSPYTVNACYNQEVNDITITAAILHEPFYSTDMSYEEKLGGIGYVISHEISHAFDINGSKYDENGNVYDWWTEEDKATFKQLCQNVVEFYRGGEHAPGILNDPELTLMENIADLGAVSCITSIGEKHENFDFKKMYESAARAWAVAMTRENAQSRSTGDVHSAPNLRVNKTLQSLDKFYEVYDINEGDGMYLPPEKRARIW